MKIKQLHWYMSTDWSFLLANIGNLLSYRIQRCYTSENLLDFQFNLDIINQTTNHSYQQLGIYADIQTTQDIADKHYKTLVKSCLEQENEDY